MPSDRPPVLTPKEVATHGVSPNGSGGIDTHGLGEEPTDVGHELPSPQPSGE